MKKTSSYNSIFVIAFAIMLLGTHFLGAQVLDKPTTIWTAACASDSFNEYDVSFRWSPPLVDSSNEFILELSDRNGNFGSPIELSRVGDKNMDFNFDFTFAVPTDVSGESYKLRVRSTSPAKTSPATDAYPMHYVEFNSPLLISEDGSGSIPSGGLIQSCGEGLLPFHHTIFQMPVTTDTIGIEVVHYYQKRPKTLQFPLQVCIMWS
ncbi:hypothetical protein [Flagellimonas sp. CMM7]|uniref:hypothetical protein n=1 Tax=Flagellimonas sp. CMM7 TaxID=2654676 RepID=UPI001F29A367|nr:hypothetical protein [Flagellimonas sp. CMM7]UII81597.1 hypothetical protein LV704_08790 [Flagellimonas sp. CMM7]